jgi:HK97 family phage portal protein
MFQKIFSRWKQKSSRVAPIIVQAANNPIWTPRRFDALAEEGYQRNVIVYRCVNLVARGLSSVPWVVFKKDSKHHEHIQPSHNLLTLLNNPSPFQAGSAFIENVVCSLLLSGNAYIEVVNNALNQPCELYCLRPDRINVVPSSKGKIVRYDYTANGKTVSIIEDPISGRMPLLHLKLFHPLNDFYGMSPLEAAASSVDQHNQVGFHNVALLQNGGRPSGALILKNNPQGLTHEQRQSLRDDLKQLYQGGTNAGRMMILEGDFEWREMGLSPKDLDFLEGKNISAREICQAFGVPPMLAGVPGDATFANYKEARLHLWEDTIIPLLEFLVAEFNLWLTPQFSENLRLSYNVDAIPALSMKREAFWQRIQSSDFLTINEKRQAVGYPPLEEGNILYYDNIIKNK